MLRPAVLDCVRRGWTVVAVARSEPDLAALAASAGPLVLPLPLDVADAASVGRASVESVLRHRVDDALFYDAFGSDPVGNAAIDRLAPLVTGTTVRILTSRWFPDAARAVGPSIGGAGPLAAVGRWPRRPGRVHLLLGVRPVQCGVRWHTPQEISAAAVEALRRRVDTVLGEPPQR